MMPELITDKILLLAAVMAALTGGAVNGATINEMLGLIFMILLAGFVWQVSITLWQCRERRKRIEKMLASRCNRA